MRNSFILVGASLAMLGTSMVPTFASEVSWQSELERDLQIQAEQILVGGEFEAQSFLSTAVEFESIRRAGYELQKLAIDLKNTSTPVTFVDVAINNCSSIANNLWMCEKETEYKYAASDDVYLARAELHVALDDSSRLISLLSEPNDADADVIDDLNYVYVNYGSRLNSRMLPSPEPTNFRLTDQQKKEMVAYAVQYALSPNSDYQVMPNDCTNFVSQALFAAGWTMTSPKDTSQAANLDSWWYLRNFIHRYLDSFTNTWSVSDSQFRFAVNRANRASLVGTYGPQEMRDAYADLKLGDLIYVDWNRTDSDTDKDHVAIVTYRRDGLVKISQRNTNRLNFSIVSWVDLAVSEQSAKPKYYVVRP